MFIHVYAEHGRKTGIIRLGRNHNNNIQPVDILMAFVQIQVPHAHPFQ